MNKVILIALGGDEYILDRGKLRVATDLDGHNHYKIPSLTDVQ